jgi:hypothetical protein
LSQKHRSKQNRSGHLHQTQRFILIIDPRKVDHDRIALTNNFGLGDTKRVNSLTDPFDRKVKAD